MGVAVIQWCIECHFYCLLTKPNGAHPRNKVVLLSHFTVHYHFFSTCSVSGIIYNHSKRLTFLIRFTCYTFPSGLTRSGLTFPVRVYSV